MQELLRGHKKIIDKKYQLQGEHITNRQESNVFNKINFFISL